MDTTYYNSPLGMIELTVEAGKLTSARFNPVIPEEGVLSKNKVLEETVKQLDEYFSGTRKAFDLPMKPLGTRFQQMVWKALVSVPFGRTISYGELSAKIGKPGAERAVGHANAENPLAIIIPCHRVVGADGKLTGYAGGLWRKNWLLTFENANGQLNLFG